MPSSLSFQGNKIKKKKSKIRKIKENKIKIVSIQMSMTFVAGGATSRAEREAAEVNRGY